MIQLKTSYGSLIVISIVVLLTRIPFLFSGLGSEEDAYGIYIVTQGIGQSGVYEYSRLPGHPVQEIVYAYLGASNFIVYNLITALLSTLGIFAFMMVLKKLKFNHYLEIGLVLSFIPVVFVNSTTSLDYLWALSFILLAFYFLVSKNYLLAGALLGIAVGCRITSGAMLLPFAIFIALDKHVDNRIISTLKIALVCLLISLLAYFPVIETYGLSFFDYYKHFDHPSFTKILFNATVGIFGGLGLLVFSVFALVFIYRITFYKSAVLSDLITLKAILFSSISVIVIYLIAYFTLPFKSEFLIPIIPFGLMSMAIYLNKNETRVLALLMLLSCFFGGVNLLNPLRGTSASILSVERTIERSSIAVDLLKGPIIADHEVRLNQLRFVNSVIEKETQFDKPTAIISGWWYNFIIAQSKKSNHRVNYYYYEPQSVLLDLKSNRNQIYYLPEQDYWNDKRFKSSFTKTLANPLFPQFEYLQL